MKKLILLSLLVFSLGATSIAQNAITMTATTPLVQQPNKWPDGNSWMMTLPIYNDLVSLNAVTPSVSNANTFVGTQTFAKAQILNHSTAAINATATATAAQVATGYITSTSAAGTAITLPTGILLGAALGATQGTTFDLFIDNTAGASTVTIVVAVNGILSAAAAANAGSQGLLTVPSGVTGQACFRLMFSSATAYTFTRIA